MIMVISQIWDPLGELSCFLCKWNSGHCARESPVRRDLSRPPSGSSTPSVFLCSSFSRRTPGRPSPDQVNPEDLSLVSHLLNDCSVLFPTTECESITQNLNISNK